MAMKLWLLKAVEGLPKGDNPWDPWYDSTFAMVIRAENEYEARSIADQNGGDEMSGYRLKKRDMPLPGYIWREPRYATCVELNSDGQPGVVIKDTAEA